MDEVVIRPARVADMAPLNEIYNHYVEISPVSFDTEPISQAAREAWFEQFDTAGPHRLLVALVHGALAGWACSRMFRPRAAYATSVETSIYLDPDRCGHGLGTRLYGELFECLKGEDLHRAYGGITLPNAASIALHRKLGFQVLGTYREVGRKFGRYWDVQWFERALPDPAPPAH